MKASVTFGVVTGGSPTIVVIGCIKELCGLTCLKEFGIFL